MYTNTKKHIIISLSLSAIISLVMICNVSSGDYPYTHPYDLFDLLISEDDCTSQLLPCGLLEQYMDIDGFISETTEYTSDGRAGITPRGLWMYPDSSTYEGEFIFSLFPSHDIYPEYDTEYSYIIVGAVCADPDGCSTPCGNYNQNQIEFILASKHHFDEYGDRDSPLIFIPCNEVPPEIMYEFTSLFVTGDTGDPDDPDEIPPPIAPPTSQLNYLNDLPSWAEIDFTRFRDLSNWVPPVDDFAHVFPTGKYWIYGAGDLPVPTNLNSHHVLDTGLPGPDDPCYETFVYLYYILSDPQYADIEDHAGIIVYLNWDANNPITDSAIAVYYDTSNGEPFLALYYDMYAFWEFINTPAGDTYTECPISIDIPSLAAMESLACFPSIGFLPGFEVFSLLLVLSIVTLSIYYKRRHFYG